MTHDAFSRWWPAALAILLLGALWLRWPVPEPLWTHIDEKAFVNHPLGFFSGDLNPHFFNYPTLQLYLASVLYWVYWLLLPGQESLADFVAYRYFVDAHDVLALARGLTTLMAVATVAVVAFLGRRLYGAGWGLLAAAFLACAPLHIRFSHLAATDVPSVLWSMLAVLWAVRGCERQHLADLLVAGVFCGLAAATKYPSGLAFAAVAAAAVIGFQGRDRQRALVLSAAVAAAVFAVATPFVWLDAAKTYHDLTIMAREHVISARHTTDSPVVVHLVLHNLRYGLGIAGLVALSAALVWRPRAWRNQELVVLAGLGAFVLFASWASSAFMRYAVPIAPLAAVLVMRPLTQVPIPRLGVALAALVLLAEPTYASWQARRLLVNGDSRAQAREAIEATLPDGGRLVHFSGRAGRPHVMTPGFVYRRELRFAQRYDMAELRDAYAILARRDDLPPLYTVYPPNIRHLSASDPDAGAMAVACRLVHPLSVPDEIDSSRDISSLVRWTETVSPGDVAAAEYDPVDLFFLPVAGFGALQRSGPEIELGSVRLDLEHSVPSTQQFFHLLSRLTEASLAREARDWPRALAVYEEILDLPIVFKEVLSHSDRMGMLYGAGAARYATGDAEGAISLWLEGVVADPNSVMLRYNLGTTLYQAGRPHPASEQLAAAVRLDPGNGDAWENLASCLHELERFPEALAAIDEALDLRPTADGFLRKGMILARLGEAGASRDAFRRVLEIDPEHPTAARLRQLVVEDEPAAPRDSP